ncbi:hypothetical protein QYM36_016704 [Artemia franciscana]|uniref:Uncharacterized protein n=1 Tax=Artemia franciscana TaxID=6661 RepID=A0AA88KSB8_ARTSF|nr:hypothetical protein QYM36_016704 [Artemia franciscana]
MKVKRKRQELDCRVLRFAIVNEGNQKDYFYEKSGNSGQAVHAYSQLQDKGVLEEFGDQRRVKSSDSHKQF